jgi:3-hydroxyacyl-[acyl-carrier-protein] dehydratase
MKIKTQIDRYLQVEEGEGGFPRARFPFPADFIGFQGHFPARGILPGACQIQCLLSFLERLGGKPLALKEVVLAKYVTPVFPGETISVVLGENPDLSGGEMTVKAVVYRGDERVSELRVRVARGGMSEA